MAITSKGYVGTVAAGADWYWLHRSGGSRYWVGGAGTEVRVTPVTNGTRQVSISTGQLGGGGIWDTVTTAETLTLPTVASGTRYFMIVARRTWGATAATSATTFAAIDAGTTGASTLPPRQANPGTVDEQPLAMVPLTAGQTVPGTPIDLRVYGVGGSTYAANSSLVLQYMTSVGTTLHVQGITYTRVATGSGSGTWITDRGVDQINSLDTLDLADVSSGWAAVGSSSGNCSWRDRNTVSFIVTVRRTGSTITPNSASGGIPDTRVARIAVPHRPNWRVMGVGEFNRSSSATYSCSWRLNTDGTFDLFHLGAGSLDLPTWSSTTSSNLRISGTFVLKG